MGYCPEAMGIRSQRWSRTESGWIGVQVGWVGLGWGAAVGGAGRGRPD